MKSKLARMWLWLVGIGAASVVVFAVCQLPWKPMLTLGVIALTVAAVYVLSESETPF